MVTVTRLEKVRSMTCIYLDSGDQYWISCSDLADTGIYEGMVASPEWIVQTIKLATADTFRPAGNTWYTIHHSAFCNYSQVFREEPFLLEIQKRINRSPPLSPSSS